jgi:hypothetical protein
MNKNKFTNMAADYFYSHCFDLFPPKEVEKQIPEIHYKKLLKKFEKKFKENN